MGVPAVLLVGAVLLVPSAGFAAPAIEQYVLDLPGFERPDAGGAAIEIAPIRSASGVAGEVEAPLSVLDSLLGTLAEPLGIVFVVILLGSGAMTLRRVRPDRERRA